MVGMYNLKYIEGIQTMIHTSVRIQLHPSLVVILCPPPSSLSLRLPLLFCCCYRRSEFHTIRMQSEFLDQDCLGKQICCSPAVIHAVIHLHSFRSALSRLSAYLLCSHSAFVTSCAVTVHSLPAVQSQCIRVVFLLCASPRYPRGAASSQRSFIYWVPVSCPVCCSVQCWRSRNAQSKVKE